jgi:hypothetical protein
VGRSKRREGENVGVGASVGESNAEKLLVAVAKIQHTNAAAVGQSRRERPPFSSAGAFETRMLAADAQPNRV